MKNLMKKKRFWIGLVLALGLIWILYLVGITAKPVPQSVIGDGAKIRAEKALN